LYLPIDAHPPLTCKQIFVTGSYSYLKAKHNYLIHIKDSSVMLVRLASVQVFLKLQLCLLMVCWSCKENWDFLITG